MLGSLYYMWIVNTTNVIKSGFGVSSFVYSFSTAGIARVRVNVSNTLENITKEVEISVINGEIQQ